MEQNDSKDDVAGQNDPKVKEITALVESENDRRPLSCDYPYQPKAEQEKIYNYTFQEEKPSK